MFSQFRRYLALLLYPSIDGHVRHLRDRNADLMAELQTYIDARPMLPSQWEDITRRLRECQGIVDEQNAVVLWLRKNRPEVFTAYQGSALFPEKKFSELVIGLLQHLPKTETGNSSEVTHGNLTTPTGNIGGLFGSIL